MADRSNSSAEFEVVGIDAERVDARDKVTGRAIYTVDMTAPRQLHGAVVRSRVAHGRIRKVDTSKALEQPEVVAVVTGQDIVDLGLFPRYGHVIVDHPILAIDKVRFIGEPVALVVAESRLAAKRAAQEVAIDYQELPRLVTVDAALADDAPLIHDETYTLSEVRLNEDERFEGPHTSNVMSSTEHGWGDVEKGFAESDTIVEAIFRYPMTYGYAMEPYNALAQFVEDTVTVWSTAQHPYMVRGELSRILHLPQSRIRVVAPYLGGGYGSKSFTKVEPLAVIGAMVTGRPVKVVLDIDESIYTTRADSAVIHGKTGFSSDGRILVRSFDIVVDGGAYADSSPLVAGKMANRCSGPYTIPNLAVRTRTIYTNTIPASSLRGFGGPQGVFAGESLMDMGARALDMEANELRALNLARRGEEFHPGKRALDSDLHADLELLVKEVGADRTPASLDGGIGTAVAATDPGDRYPISTALVRIHSDGTAAVLTGATEMGQGSRTALSQIAAEELGLPLTDVAIVQSDTGIGPFERSTGASRTTTLTGLAIQRAATDARSRIRSMAVEMLASGDGGDVEVERGGVMVGDQFLSYGEVIRSWFGTAGGEVVGFGSTRREDHLTDIPIFWEVGVVSVEIDVDRDTGKIDVSRIVTVGDCGFAINPRQVHGQEVGAALGGLGAALTEEIVYEGSEPINASIVDYRVPRIDDWPEAASTLLAERRDGAGPYGSRGSGEGAVHPIGAAVANALEDATGVRITELPLTPERVWRALRESQMEGRTR